MKNSELHYPHTPNFSRQGLKEMSFAMDGADGLGSEAILVMNMPYSSCFRAAAFYSNSAFPTALHGALNVLVSYEFYKQK